MTQVIISPFLNGEKYLRKVMLHMARSAVPPICLLQANVAHFKQYAEDALADWK